MPLVATLIANPENPRIPRELADGLAGTLGTKAPDWLAPGIACDLQVGSNLQTADILETCRSALGGLTIDAVVQDRDARRKRILLADMDSTMIKQECLDELAGAIGIREQVALITARAMNGEIEFEPALRERVALLKGLPVGKIGDIIETRITLAPGGRELVATMKRTADTTRLSRAALRHLHPKSRQSWDSTKTGPTNLSKATAF